MNRLLVIASLCVNMCTGETTPAFGPQPLPVRAAAVQWADYYAQDYGVPSEFVAAIIDVESAWRPYAVSEKGAAGIMQLMPATAFQLGVTNRFQIQENIRGGVAHLAHLMRQFRGDLRLVAAAYYTGEKRIGRLGLNCPDPGVYRYVTAVARSYRLRQRLTKRKS